jgi:hypothetical protein
MRDQEETRPTTPEAEGYDLKSFQAGFESQVGYQLERNIICLRF